MNSSLDLSKAAELSSLAKLVRTIDAIAPRWFIVGATARDLLLRYGQGLDIRRYTVDVDIAIAVRTWKEYRALTDSLVARGARRDRKVHRFYLDEWTLDLLPFGGVASNDEIAWPPDGDPVMSVLGFEEASENTIRVLLPGAISVEVVTIPALFLMKLIAWNDRHYERPRDDARDISLLLKSYAGSWNDDRLYDTAADLLEKFAFDNERAAAALLGSDTAAIARPRTRDHLISMLQRETSDDIFKLAREMDGRTEDNLQLLEAALFGLKG
jgi:predicted nucleotidyltransferase